MIDEYTTSMELDIDKEIKQLGEKIDPNCTDETCPNWIYLNELIAMKANEVLDK